MLLSERVKLTITQFLFAEFLGINHLMNIAMFFIFLMEVPPTSDENVTVTETTFDGIPVRVYVPRRKSETLRRGLFYIHGGGWCLGSAAMLSYDFLSRNTANRLDAVVVSTNYRLAPKYHFPIQFEDVYGALSWFLRKDILEKYGVDPERVGVSGDSAGGNLAAAVTQQFLFAEFLGINHFMNIAMFFVFLMEVPPTSDENVTVTETTFNGIPVRVYVPRRKSETLRRGLFYIHGGGWCLGSAAVFSHDFLSRHTANRLDAVVISTNYRLAPKYHFPIQFEDVYGALSWFLRKDILEKYGVDPERVGVSGGSAGGNLAAAVTQQLLGDPNAKVKLKTQSLIYPALQNLDLDLPSYRENAEFPILSKSLAARYWSEYFTTDRSLEKALLLNQHVPVDSSHLFKYVNWSSLLPEKFKKGHVYNTPTYGSSELAQKYPGFLDVRAAPLLAEDTQMRGLPRTHVMTCQYDVLRDDGVMYVTRLRNNGVHVTHTHIEDGFHGAISFLNFKISNRMANQYIDWLRENL
uniref:Arylacetamide deacetylase n=1 Tax=Oryctolagus cuniculus TaxID=9986 RepID=A0A5F9CSG5_RABIT